MFICVALDIGSLRLSLVFFAFCSALLLVSGREIATKSIALFSEHNADNKG